MRHSVPLVFLRNDIVKGLEIVELNSWEICPFRFRLESGPKLPFAGMSRGGDQTSLALFGFLTPFVFLHDSWSLEVCDRRLRILRLDVREPGIDGQSRKGTSCPWVKANCRRGSFQMQVNRKFDGFSLPKKGRLMVCSRNG